jgi:undecaprenyl-diphosphatase
MERRAALRPVLVVGRRLAPEIRFVVGRLTPGRPLGLEFTSLLAILAVALYAVVGYALVLSGNPGATSGDQAAFDIADQLQAGWVTDVAKVVTALGAASVTLPLALIAAVVLAVRRNWTEAATLVVAYTIIYVAVPELKDAVARPRPSDPLVDVGGYAYPSGHAAHAMIYPWLALTLTVRLRPGMAGGSALLATGFVLAALVGLTRVYLHVHYMSDVVGGWALGAAAFAGCGVIAMVVTHFRQNARRVTPRPVDE